MRRNGLTLHGNRPWGRLCGRVVWQVNFTRAMRPAKEHGQSGNGGSAQEFGPEGVGDVGAVGGADRLLEELKGLGWREAGAAGGAGAAGEEPRRAVIGAPAIGGAPRRREIGRKSVRGPRNRPRRRGNAPKPVRGLTGPTLAVGGLLVKSGGFRIFAIRSESEEKEYGDVLRAAQGGALGA